jgi:hypothetical protein
MAIHISLGTFLTYKFKTGGLSKSEPDFNQSNILFEVALRGGNHQ